MNIYKLSEIYIYPIKSLGGIPVNSAEVTDRGLKLDRRWMLVDEDNKFFTQRLVKTMALLHTSIAAESLIVFKKTNPKLPNKASSLSKHSQHTEVSATKLCSV